MCRVNTYLSMIKKSLLSSTNYEPLDKFVCYSFNIWRISQSLTRIPQFHSIQKLGVCSLQVCKLLLQMVCHDLLLLPTQFANYPYLKNQKKNDSNFVLVTGDSYITVFKKFFYVPKLYHQLLIQFPPAPPSSRTITWHWQWCVIFTKHTDFRTMGK